VTPGVPEFGSVRNGSELTSTVGRPPVVDDECLLRLAEKLSVELGRLPKADELISAAGGCQRSRALASIRALKLTMAEREVRSNMKLPAATEAALRSQMVTWLDLAANQLAQRHLEESERQERKCAAQAGLIEELQARVAALQECLTERDRAVSDMTSRCERAEATLASSESRRAEQEVLAAERGRLLEKLGADLRRSRRPSRT
jgi:uncharacterized coiled-coil protein SlyX